MWVARPSAPIMPRTQRDQFGSGSGWQACLGVISICDDDAIAEYLFGAMASSSPLMGAKRGAVGGTERLLT
jgi:hypothetical protein